MNRRYVIITPARNEQTYLETTITCVVSQTTRPVQWIVVNDGSSDTTGDIIDRHSAQHPWITSLHLAERPCNHLRATNAVLTDKSRALRALEAKEIEAFYRGYEVLTHHDWEFIVKLDADLWLPPHYFSDLFAEFDQDLSLGIGGGAVCNKVNGKWTIEQHPEFHVRGATKIYRRQCWDAIGGVRRGAGWDTLDEVRANMLGWKTRTFTDHAIKHLRPTGAANGAWGNGVKNGLWDYACGYHPLFMVAKCLKRVSNTPILIDAAAHVYGFLRGILSQVPKQENKELITYLRSQQLRKLTFRKTIWK